MSIGYSIKSSLAKSPKADKELIQRILYFCPAVFGIEKGPYAPKKEEETKGRWMKVLARFFTILNLIFYTLTIYSIAYGTLNVSTIPALLVGIGVALCLSGAIYSTMTFMLNQMTQAFSHLWTDFKKLKMHRIIVLGLLVGVVPIILNNTDLLSASSVTLKAFLVGISIFLACIIMLYFYLQTRQANKSSTIKNGHDRFLAIALTALILFSVVMLDLMGAGWLNLPEWVVTLFTAILALSLFLWMGYHIRRNYPASERSKTNLALNALFIVLALFTAGFAFSSSYDAISSLQCFQDCSAVLLAIFCIGYTVSSVMLAYACSFNYLEDRDKKISKDHNKEINAAGNKKTIKDNTVKAFIIAVKTGLKKHKGSFCLLLIAYLLPFLSCAFSAIKYAVGCKDIVNDYEFWMVAIGCVMLIGKLCQKNYSKTSNNIYATFTTSPTQHFTVRDSDINGNLDKLNKMKEKYSRDLEVIESKLKSQSVDQKRDKQVQKGTKSVSSFKFNDHNKGSGDGCMRPGQQQLHG
jgi:hypothetical protein